MLRMLNRSAAPGAVEFMVVGLGNPGREYERTRHNAGFLALDRLAEQQGAELKRIRFKGITGDCALGGRRTLLLKPSTYMNLSGQSVTEAMRFYKLLPEQVLILCDDVNLDVGRVRIRRKGSDGGQNGVKNILYLSGSDQFPRVKLGVGKRPNPDYDLADWVLSRFSDGELKLLSPALDAAAQAAAMIAAGDIDGAMNAFN